NEYPGRMTLTHIDAYRLERAEQLTALGFEEIRTSGSVVVVEWAEKVWEIMEPHGPLTIRLKHLSQTERELELDHVPEYLLDRINPPQADLRPAAG
ncbi:MAG: tRNA (adenosine(37)-N6)-threonylcarbamoyltransferase complex ATPase subunit type 1 TsaE, partial [Planctomycetes bacterium]|nr:tRNA (adenosine(37)-N6)-threonylcarbamoyltransferase complex ATPase subunit type 1 TsaE [Planctomycetota bacterium]